MSWLNSKLILLTCMACCLFGNLSIAQEEDPAKKRQFETNKRVRLTMDLTQEEIAELKNSGKLRLRIPEYYKNRIAAIVLRHVDTYLEEKVRVNGEPIIEDDKSQVRVDELMLERLNFQPLEFRVFEKNFSYVEIQYVHEPETRIFVDGDDANLTREEYQIRIADRFDLRAKINRIEELNLTSQFGKLSVAWDTVEQIHLTELGQARLFLKNGNVISGHLDLGTLDIKTRWGKITIPASDIRVISR